MANIIIEYTPLPNHTSHHFGLEFFLSFLICVNYQNENEYRSNEIRDKRKNIWL